MNEEPLWNPMAPADEPTPKSTPNNVQKANLSNEDFRKLMMTPSANIANTPAFGAKVPSSVRGHRRQVIISEEFKKPESAASLADKKKNKKKFHQKKDADQEENILAELAKKYRDRAKERREHVDEEGDHQLSTSGYNSVANMTSEDAAERRKQLIEESKYLGGDIEHTHLVKGLDYALLHKVKAEIDFERDQETLKLVEDELTKKRLDSEDELDSDEEQDWSIKSPLAQNLMTLLFENNLPERNDYFLPGRLAYIFDLENDCPTDAFTSIIRSKADCPNWDAEQNTLSTSDIVLNKLIEIFEELRESGGKRRKKLKSHQINQPNEEGKFNFINQSCSFGTSSTSGSIKGSDRSPLASESKDHKANKVVNDINIYDDIDDDYVLPHKRKEHNAEKSNHSTRSNSIRTGHYSGDYDRDYDRDRRRRDSSSKDRYRRSSSSDSSDEYRREKYREKDRYSSRDRERDSYSRSSSYRDDKYKRRRY